MENGTERNTGTRFRWFTPNIITNTQGQIITFNWYCSTFVITLRDLTWIGLDFWTQYL